LLKRSTAAATRTLTTQCKRRTTNDEVCLFPFTYEGVRYYDCAPLGENPDEKKISSSRGSTWCPTGNLTSTDKANDVYVTGAGSWGVCQVLDCDEAEIDVRQSSEGRGVAEIHSITSFSAHTDMVQEIHLFKRTGYVRWTLTISPTAVPHTAGTRITQGGGVHDTAAAGGHAVDPSEGVLQSTTGATVTSITQLVVVTNLGVVLDSEHDLMIHEDVPHSFSIVVDKADVLSVSFVEVPNTPAPLECAVSGNCYMQGKFRLSLDLSRSNVLGGSETTSGGFYDHDLARIDRVTLSNLVVNGNLKDEALDGGHNGGIAPKGWTSAGDHVHVRRPLSTSVVLHQANGEIGGQAQNPATLDTTVEIYQNQVMATSSQVLSRRRATVYQVIPTVIGRTYRVSYQVWATTGGSEGGGSEGGGSEGGGGDPLFTNGGLLAYQGQWPGVHVSSRVICCLCFW
jgi:hypothetical protein